jgi:hypothetical protein
MTQNEQISTETHFLHLCSLADISLRIPWEGAAQGFSPEVDGLAYGGWTFWLTTFYLDIGPLGIAFPLDEVPPDHLDRRRDDCGGTDCQAHSMFLLSIGIDEGKVSFTLCLHPGLTKLPALASLDQEGSLPVHAS